VPEISECLPSPAQAAEDHDRTYSKEARTGWPLELRLSLDELVVENPNDDATPDKESQNRQQTFEDGHHHFLMPNEPSLTFSGSDEDRVP
jgi:hypothetical protein